MRHSIQFGKNVDRLWRRIPPAARRKWLLTSVVVLGIVLPALLFLFNGGATTTVETAGGIHRITWSFKEGKIIVSLPSDLSAGDPFLHGSVAYDPAGAGSRRSANFERLREKPLLLGERILQTQNEIFSIRDIPSGAAITLAADGQRVSIPLIAQAPSPREDFGFPDIVQSGWNITVVGPMRNGLNTRLSIGGTDAQLIVKSPRQATFAAPSAVGPAHFLFMEDEQAVAGNVNLARFTLERSDSRTRNEYRWSVAGLQNAPPTAFPITIILISGSGENVSATMGTIGITAEQVVKGRASGIESFDQKTSAPITASILGADLFSRGYNPRSPWSARLHASDDPTLANPELTGSTPFMETRGSALPQTQSTTTPGGCETGSTATPAQCQSQGQPGLCLSMGQPRNCQSYKTPAGGFEPCQSVKGADGKYDGCISQNYPDRCVSLKNPSQCPTSTRSGTACTSTATGTTCSSTATGTTCSSTATGTTCTSTAAGTTCSSTATGTTCTSTATGTTCTSTATGTTCTSTASGTTCTSTAAGSTCSSTANPVQCQSQGQPGVCLSMGQPRTCESYKTPSGGFEPCQSIKGANGKYDGCVSQNYPDRCVSLKNPAQCPTSTATGAVCASSQPPPKCDVSKTNPSRCVSTQKPKECSQGTPLLCHSTQTPNGGFEPCVSYLYPDGKYDGCVSQREPKLCPDNTSAQQPSLCVSQKQPDRCSQGTPPTCHSTKTPTGGFEPCVSYKYPNGQYDGCISQREPTLCPNLSKADPKQCIQRK